MTKRIISPVLGLALGTALLFTFMAGPANAASKVPVQLRVVTYQGKVLADKTIKTGTSKVKTSNQATCLGGSPTNGSKTVEGPTALGLLNDASSSIKSLRPLQVSNAFDFGLGLCGVGSSVAQNEEWWVLKYDHTDSFVGGEGQVVKKGGTVLWYLAQSYNEATPNELFLKAPAKVKKKKSFKVRVFEYNGKGKRKPVKGARISGTSAALTNAKGYTRVKLNKKTNLLARYSGTIPSNRATIKIKK
ncbi:MAG: hypothetical protein WBW62_01500 [Solirubrobacterales bacterium]